MKKAITILSICLFTIGGTQTTHAQTKEETIAWIKEKLEKYGGESGDYVNYYTDIQVSPCRISWTTKHVERDWVYFEHFNPSATKSWTVSDNKDAIVAGAKIIQTVDGGKGIGNFSNAFLHIKPGEADIHERMIKALLHLATFCDEGKNEAF